MQKLFVILCSCIFLIACTSDQKPVTASPSINNSGEAESPNISIQIENMQSGPVYLLGTYSDKTYRVDSTSINTTGSLRFQGGEPYKAGSYYVIFPNGMNLQIMIDKDQTMDITTDANDLINTSQVKGNVETQLLFDNLRYEQQHRTQVKGKQQQMAQHAPGSAEYNQLQSDVNTLGEKRLSDLQSIFDQYPGTLFASFKKAGQNPKVSNVTNPDGSPNNALKVYLYRRAFWKNVNFDDERLLYTPVIANKLNRYLTELTTQKADSLVSSVSFLIDQVLDKPEYFKLFSNSVALKYQPGESSVMDAEKLYVFMVQNYFTKERAFWSDSMNIYSLQQRAHEMAASLVGLKGPNITSTDQNGQTRSLYDLKSDYIVVYMYNPTCEHCMVESPKLVELYNQTNRKELDVFAIGVDTDDKEWKDYIKKLNMQWTNVYDPTNQSIYAKYFVDVTPEIYVLNPDRTIIAKNLKVHQIMKSIDLDKK